MSITYAERAEVGGLVDDRTIAMIEFGDHSSVDCNDPHRLSVGLPPLEQGATVEVWQSRDPLQRSESAGIQFVKSDALLFAALFLDEANYTDLESATHDGYRRIVKLAEEQGYPHLLRVWNYLPDINAETHGLERYQAFCIGRYQALKARPDFEHHLPAACTIGTRSPGFLIYFLASKDPGVQIENPRQTSAFHYPRRYGPKSPSFSRAVLRGWGEESHLYISGTASIVGLDTLHQRDALSQLDETLNNLDSVITHANKLTGSRLRFSLLKTYIRNSIDLVAVKERITRRFGDDVPLLILRGDICREDLLIELEGICRGGA